MDTLINYHAYWRNIWLWTCFSLGTFNSVYYYGESIFITSVSLSLLPPLFISYLVWDAYKMLTYKQLYRSDLLVHHTVCLVVYGLMTYYNWNYIMSLLVIAENLSLFNYWLEPPSLLKYKLFILVFYRIPFWSLFLYSSFGNAEYADHLYKLITGLFFFIGYDLFMIKKIIQNPNLCKL